MDINQEVRDFVAKLATEDAMAGRPLKSFEEVNKLVEEFKKKREEECRKP